MAYRQSPPPQGACPRCYQPLVTWHGRADVHLCATCGGVFADNACSRVIVAALDRALLEIGFRAALGATRKTDTALAIACPECLVTMQRVTIHAAVCDIDVCPDHGTWFDAGELQDVMRAYANHRKRGGRAPHIAPPDPDDKPFGEAETAQRGSIYSRGASEIVAATGRAMSDNPGRPRGPATTASGRSALDVLLEDAFQK